MMDRELLEQQLGELPLYFYGYIDPKSLDFSTRVRYICSAECPMFGKTWACPPAASTIVIGERLGGYSLIGDVIDGYYKGQAVDMHIGSTLSLALMIIILISIAVMNHFDNGEDLAVV